MPGLEILSPYAIISFVAHLAGLVMAAHAVMHIKRSQSAVAWCLALIGIPLAAIPLYLAFGRGQFDSYVRARLESNTKLRSKAFDEKMRLLNPALEHFKPPEIRVLKRLESVMQAPFTRSNAVELLIDGESAFPQMIRAIEQAERYILVQFFIVRDDRIGRRFKDALIKKAGEENIEVYFLYDELGCARLPGHYLDDFEDAGVRVCSFNAARGPGNLLYMNFRNHRKILVVDGKTAFIGGLNLGDEYMGRAFGKERWRDTHTRIEGPAVQAAQLSFVEDWYWAASAIPQVLWDPRPAQKDHTVLVAPTNPDGKDTAILLFSQLIEAAQKRLWIVSPYFIPDRPIMKALQAAGLRGVDVRIMLPAEPDHVIVWLASFTFFEEAQTAGVKFYCYEGGFLHQKVLLIDDYLSAVGTANLDNRSLSLNFEVTLVVADRAFAAAVERMLDKDFNHCSFLDERMFEARPLHFRFAARMARLFSPLL